MKKKMLIIGLTGQTGAGKSTVSRMFFDRGATVLNADLIAKETIEGSSQCLTDLALAFSTEMLTPEGTLNRKKLAEICFSDPAKLKQLGDITYPHIIRCIQGKIEEMRARGAELLVLDAPTLYESGLHRQCDRVIAVIADEETRMRRIIQRDSMTDEEARRRIDAQHKDTFYTERADYIIKNDDDVNTLRVSFLGVYGELEQALGGNEDTGALAELADGE